MYRDGKKPNEVVLISHIDPCIIITPWGVFKVKDGKMEEVKPHVGVVKAFWLSQALDKDFDPGEYEPSFIAEIH